MSELRLVIFDVDGTLVDSQGLIVRSMEAAFDGVGLPAPSRDKIKGIVGLSLDRAVALLAPAASDKEVQHIVQTYKDAFFTYRSAEGAAASSPFFSGAREVLDQLRADPWTLLAQCLNTFLPRFHVDFINPLWCSFFWKCKIQTN